MDRYDNFGVSSYEDYLDEDIIFEDDGHIAERFSLTIEDWWVKDTNQAIAMLKENYGQCYFEKKDNQLVFEVDPCGCPTLNSYNDAIRIVNDIRNECAFLFGVFLTDIEVYLHIFKVM
jgi:hypothetical protein